MKRTNKGSFALVGKALTERGQLSNLFGSWLFSWGLRITAGAAFVGALGYAAHSFGELVGKDWGLTAKEAWALPKATGLVLLLPGAVAKYAPRILNTNISDASQAESLNSMQEWRRKGTLEHLVSLWQRVFEPEAKIRYTEKDREQEQEFIRKQIEKLPGILDASLDIPLKEFLGIKDDDKGGLDSVMESMLYANPFSERLEKSLMGFVISSMYTLRTPMSRLSSEQEIGYGIWQLLNWQDGGTIDKGDKKLREVYFGDKLLRRIRREVSGEKFPEIYSFPGVLRQNIVFSYITKMLAADALRESRQFNHDYRTDSTVSQTWLFPGEEDLKLFDELAPGDKEMPPAREEFIRRRALMIRGRFGRTLDDADSVLDEMVVSSFERASRDRRAYDAEYIDHPAFRAPFSIGYSYGDDLESIGCCHKDTCRCADEIENPRRALVLFTKYLRVHYPGLFEFHNAETLRALRTLFHINKYSMKEEFIRRAEGLRIDASPEEVSGQVGVDYRRDRLHNYVERARFEKGDVTRNLLALRTHQTLTMLEIGDYRTLLYNLAYSDKVEEILRKNAA